MSSGGTPNTNVKNSLSNSFSEDIGYGGETDTHCSGNIEFTSISFHKNWTSFSSNFIAEYHLNSMQSFYFRLF